jgi:hypothetical protein
MTQLVGRDYVGHRCLVLATYRTSETTGPLNDLVTDIRRTDPEALVELQPLRDSAVAELAGDLPADLIADITRRATTLRTFARSPTG